ncbi:uncharacterized protein LOC116307378 [Actinia tenebrosa]|uniref:Uncharacterized protein LOC116307378 n=1 Tax=Actinia tenebrosa TaxID=6105 RepID=A0A6P8J1L6_ACTTE|nr:uncharacterized protein LOC116307378 [Actinia tenebrosa]XP_031573472.1 uncharacterized protein LOC116307378 [Actinia tenebrosa]
MDFLKLSKLVSVFFFFWFLCSSGRRQDGLAHPVDNFADKSLNVSASRVCKPGPSLTNAPQTKKCLVIGDSVSIGYTPWLETSLQNLCQVYHAPWDTADGGALDTKYAVECLSLFLASNVLQKIQYDVIVFNFGIHDVNYDGFPEEFTDEKMYRKNLISIKESLQATGSKMGYVLTTPIPYNITINDRVKRYNTVARQVMASGQPVPTADLYNWVVLVCGEPPYNSCVIADKQPSPHYTRQGYKYLSVLVEGLFRDLQIDINRNGTEFLTERKHGIKAQVSNHINQLINKKHPNKDTSFLSCKDTTGKTVTKCPQTMTCSPCKYSMTGWGCCPLSNAVSCKDGRHCCPEGYECDPLCTIELCFCIKEENDDTINKI